MNLKYPSENTIRNFYNNFNYGLFWSEQMRAALHMDQKVTQCKTNTEETVAKMQQLITDQFPVYWTTLCRQNRVKTNFKNEPVDISHQLQVSIAARDAWLVRAAKTVVVDFCNTIADEDVEDIIFSESEAEGESEDEIEDIDEDDFDM